MRRTTSLALGFFLACGAIAGAILAGLVPAGLSELCHRELLKSPFVLNRSSDDLVEITEARWFLLPYIFGDFDLHMDIELADGVELDMLLRQVEPRYIDDVILPFAGRFSVLRLSTEGDGVGWRTREQALLGPTGNGVGLAAGHLATVSIEARGRLLRANVAGKWQPWFEADDVYGMLTMVVKGGKAVVHRLHITPYPIAHMWMWSIWTWVVLAMLGCALVAAAAFMLASKRHLLSGGVMLVFFTWLIVRRIESDLAFPAPGAMLSLLAGLVTLSLLWVLGELRGWRYLLVAASAFGFLLLGHQGFERDTSQVDSVFGPKAGAQLSEAHGQLVRGPTGLLGVAPDRRCVFLLGGSMIYDQGRSADHLGLLLERQLRGQLGKRVDVPTLPTVDGFAAQQWRMFEQFYQGFEPDVVVLGIGPMEDVEDELTGVPRSSAAILRQTVRAAHDACEQRQSKLILYADVDVPDALMLELRQWAAKGIPLVVADTGEGRMPIARKLAAACKPFLK